MLNHNASSEPTTTDQENAAMQKLSSRSLRCLLAAVCMHMAFAPLAGQAQSRDCVSNLAGQTVCPPPKTLCVREGDNPGIKCSPVDGGIILDRYGKAACGVGSCALDVRGDPFCSKLAGGAAANSMQSEPVCSGGCEPAKAALCSTLSK